MIKVLLLGVSGIEIIAEELKKYGYFDLRVEASVADEVSIDCDVCVYEKEAPMLKGTKLIAVLDAENFSPDSLPNASEIVFRPFTAAELCARILRLIAPANRIYEKNGLKIDFNNAEVSYNGELIHLTLLEYKLLALLAQNHGTVVGYKKILSSLWEYPIGNEMLSIRVFITAIRKKLAAAGANETFIVNKMGSGYMLS